MTQYYNKTVTSGLGQTTLQCLVTSVGEMCNAGNNGIVQQIKFNAQVINPGIGRVTIRDNNNTRWEVPNLGISADTKSSSMYMLESLGFQLETTPQFGFQFI